MQVIVLHIYDMHVINVVQLLVDSAGGKFKYKTIIVFNENKKHFVIVI